MSEAQSILTPINVLILEDQEADAILMVRELHRAGYSISWKRVETKDEFLEALMTGSYEVVLSDYALPLYNARRALEDFQSLKIDIPFIVVTGSLGEEEAVELMKMGISDYLIKDRLARLGGAVSASLEQKRLRDERRQTLQQLRDSEERFRRITENAPDLLYRYRLDPAPAIEYFSPAVEKMTGYTVSELYARPDTALGLVYPDKDVLLERFIREPSVKQWTCKNGSRLWIELRSVAVYDDAGRMIAVEGIARDITEQVMREREREAIISVAAALREAITREEIIAALLEKTADLVKADGAAFGLINLINNAMQVEFGLGCWEEWQGKQVDLDMEIARSIIEGEPYFSPDAMSSRVATPLEWVKGIRAILCVPLRSHDQKPGFLWLCSRGVFQNQDQQEQNLRLLAAISDIAASSLHRAHLYDETQQRVKHLTALRAIDRAITASLDLHLTMNVLLDQLLFQKGVDGVDVLLVDPYTHQLHINGLRGFRGKFIEGNQVRMSESLAGKVVLNRKILHIPELADDAQASAQKDRFLSEGFHAYLGVPLIAKGEVLGVLEILGRQPQEENIDWLEFVEALAGQVAIAINNAELFEKLQRATYDTLQAYDATIEGWSRALEMREIETRGHTNRVVQLSIELGRAMGMPDADLVHLRRGALLHDIGTLALPDNILLKPGPLTDEELKIMRRHSEYAYEWLSPILYLNPALDIPYCHHENWDGSGYPRKLKGAQIPLAARIFSVVDVWDALRSDRPFREAWPRGKAYEYIRQMSGIKFDPEVVVVFLHLVQTPTGPLSLHPSDAGR